MHIWIIEFASAVLSSLVAVSIGSGGDVLFLSSTIFLVPLISHHALNTYNVGPLVAVQGIIATLLGGIAYARIVNIPKKFTLRAIATVTIGSICSSVVAFFLPSETLKLILAIAITLGALRVIVVSKKKRHESRRITLRTESKLLLVIFLISILTGSVGVGGGFLFFLALMRIFPLGRSLRGLTLILTCTNLVASFLGHALTVTVSFGSISIVMLGAVAGSILGASLIRRLSEKTAQLGLQILLAGSAIMSWIAWSAIAH